MRHHADRGAAATVLTARVDRPHGYGRIVRKDGAIAAIVEHKDATAAERAIDEINSGIYAFALEPLFDALRTIGAANAQGEYYLPDLVRIYRERGLAVETVSLADPREILGVNSRRELADVTAILKTTRNDELMAAGVSIVDPATAWIGPDVVIGADTILHPNVYLEGRTRIGAALRDPRRRPHRRLDARRRRRDQQLLRDHRVARQVGREGRSVRAHPAAIGRRRGRARRQLHRAEKDDARGRARRRTTCRISATR